MLLFVLFWRLTLALSRVAFGQSFDGGTRHLTLVFVGT